jgi:hypothetical protein
MTAKEGKAEELLAALAGVRESAYSDAEPGTLEFRVCRAGNEIMIFEQLSPCLFLMHASSELILV